VSLREPFRVVLDTNTLLRGLVSQASAAALVRLAAEKRQIIPLLSKPVVDEYRKTLLNDELTRRFSSLNRELVDTTIQHLRFVGEYIRTPAVTFEYRRDVRDEKFIELAIALNATHILSYDDDLLSLPDGRDAAAKRFRQRLPSVEIMDASSFLRMHGARLGIIL
jgi:putative PIN family toxin of toxin-antitoxin system